MLKYAWGSLFINEVSCKCFISWRFCVRIFRYWFFLVLWHLNYIDILLTWFSNLSGRSKKFDHNVWCFANRSLHPVQMTPTKKSSLQENSFAVFCQNRVCSSQTRICNLFLVLRVVFWEPKGWISIWVLFIIWLFLHQPSKLKVKKWSWNIDKMDWKATQRVKLIFTTTKNQINFFGGFTFRG